MKRYLHIGCGDVILPPPFENLDGRDLDGVDYISSVYPLEFDSNCFDLIYSSHVLEHFHRNKTLDVLKEWVRVLRPDGILRLSVPSFENLIKIYEISGEIDSVSGPLMGGQTYETNFHYNVFDKKYLTYLMEQSGLVAVHPWDFRRTSHSKHFDFSQATTWEIPISLNLEGRKE